ncbi:RES family NAD+ phosphorylase [Burkholderia cenocepacia]|nr:RES family NAD+ phosphorylase [Burkholderia cenocepacia]
MPTHICSECFEDSHLRDMVRREGVIGKCRKCEEWREGISTERLGQILAPILREVVRPGEIVPFYDGGKIRTRQHGDSIAEWVYEVLGQALDFEHEIVDAIIATDVWNPRRGGEPFWNDDQNYERIPPISDDYLEKWRGVLLDVKHQRRFFSEMAGQFFTELFDGVESMYVPSGRRRLRVVKHLAKGTRLFRARVVTSGSKLREMIEDPLKHIGPPPLSDARSGRMNAEGISVFYGASERDTCLAEMRPSRGNDIALIELETTRKLRILDFCRLDGARMAKSLSYFQQDFKPQRARRQFLRILHTLIAQPVTSGREGDYLITQTMAEYLSHVARPRFDGIIFQSTQRTGGKNIVLFPNAMVDADGAPQGLPLTLVDNEVHLYKTQAITYSHERQPYYQERESDEIIPLTKPEVQPQDDAAPHEFWNGACWNEDIF